MHQITVEGTQDRIQRLVAVRPRLVSFARLQLRDLVQAEDAVQEAIATAIEKDDTFAGRSGYETWVFGILKYKILDALRAQWREGWWQPLDDELDEAAIDSAVPAERPLGTGGQAVGLGGPGDDATQREVLAGLRPLHDRPSRNGGTSILSA